MCPRTRGHYLLAALASVLLGSLSAAAGTVFVDWRNSGFQDGTAAHPYQTLPPALAVAAPGDTIAIRTGSYGLDGGPLVFNKSATVRADNGLVTIGIPPPVRVSGPADIDFAGCAPSGTHGTVSGDYWIIREPNVSGPLNVALEGLPADVTGTVDPQTLLFPGNVISQRVNVTLTTIAGPTVPDTFVTLHITGDGIDMPFGILLHGSCPQQNRNFVIRGQFGYMNARNVEPDKGFQPLTGVQVEIFRHRSDWYDDKVGGAYTDDEGRFSLDLYASRDGDYYARLRLSSPEVEVEDADKSSVWSIDTQHQSNRGGLIEVGSIQIWNNGGNGTPRAAVWQGFRNAALEFPNNFGETVPGGFFRVQIWRGQPARAITFYNEVHYLHGDPTGEQGNPYRTTWHEFAHVFRDVLDGSESHWHGDDALYIYGRGHSCCSAPVTGSANAGFAFHEGWGEYWSREITCCDSDIDNQDIEGTVAHDLNNLANTLSRDRNISRKGMLQVLERGPNLIHSDAEFRREYAKQFPNVAPGNISDGCPQGNTGNICHRVPDQVQSTGMQPEVDPAEQRKNLVAAIAERQKAIAAFQEEERSSTGLRTFMLRAAVEEGTLVVQRMQDELVALDRGDPPELYLRRGAFEQLRRAQFVAQRKAIQIRALRDASAVASAEQRPEIERRIRLLQESRIEDASLESMLSLPAVAGDDTIAAPPHSPPWWWHWVTLIVVTLIVALIILVLYVVQIRRGRRSSG